VDDDAFTAFVAAAEVHCGRELDVEWDGRSTEVTVYTTVPSTMREAVEAIGAGMGIRVAWQ
jgi:hypothetical protein